MVAVKRTMFSVFILASFVVTSVTSATQVRFKRQELLPPLEMRLQDNIPGQPVLDYPIFDQVPDSSFLCSSQQHPGYYADLDARCQVFHICQFSGRQDSFLCPNGTVFDQRYFVCNWWFNVDCGLSPTFYSFNSQLFRSSDSSVLVQDVLPQDVSFDHPESLPVPGVVGGGSVIPAAHNGFREPHSLDDSGFVPSPRDWEIASTSGSVSSWSRPSDDPTRGRSMAMVSATRAYPDEETSERDLDYRRFNVPVTTYRPLMPYRPPETRIVNDRPSTDRYPQEEEPFPEEIAPEEPGGYYTPRRVPERQSPTPMEPTVGAVTNAYPTEEEFFSRETFVEDATQVVPEVQKPVPLTPEEAVGLMPDYDTYTSLPEPSPFDEDFNYGRKLHVPSTVTAPPVRSTSPRVKTRHQQTPISSYPAEEDLPLEEMLPITEQTPLPQSHSTRSPYYSPPAPFPDPIHQRPLVAEPEVDYRSKQTLQFVSSRIPVIVPEVQTQTTRQALEFVTTPVPERLDFRPTPNIQILSTPSPVLESSTEFSNVSVESMTRDTISFGQSYIPEIVDAQSELPVGGTSTDVQNNLFEYGNPEQPPIKTQEAVTGGHAFQPSRRPAYPTQYSAVQEPLSAEGPTPRHPLTNPTFNTNQQNNKLNYPEDEEFIPPAIPVSNSPTSTPVYPVSIILEEINNPGINQNNGNNNNGNHNNGNHNNGNHNNGNHNNGNHNNGNLNNGNHNNGNNNNNNNNGNFNNGNHNNFNNGDHNNLNNGNHNNVNPNNLNNGNHNNLNNGNHNNGNHNNVNPNNLNNGNFNNGNHNNFNNVNHNHLNNVNPNNLNNGNHNNFNNGNLNNGHHNNVNNNNGHHNNVNHNNVNHNNVNNNNGHHNNVNHNNVNNNNGHHNNVNNNNGHHNNGHHNNGHHNNVNQNHLSNVNPNNLNNGNLNINNHNNPLSNAFGPLEILTIDNKPVQGLTHESIMVHRPTYVNIRPSYGSTPNQGQLEDIVVPTLAQNLLAPYPQRGSLQNNPNAQQNPSRVPHFNRINNNQNGVLSNNNNLRARQNDNFNDKLNSFGAALNGVTNQFHQNGKRKPIPSNGFWTNPRDLRPLSVPLISVPIRKPIDKEWSVDKSSATKSRRFKVRSGSRPLVIRLAADPRVPPQIEINRRIGNGARHKTRQSRQF